MIVFPEPRIWEPDGNTVRLRGRASVDAGPNASEIERHAASLIEQAAAGEGVRVTLGTPTGNPAISASMLSRLDGVPNDDQGYVLTISEDNIVLAGKTPLGAMYAAQTLLQMMGPDGSIPTGTVVDWPERKYRGIFAESRWCSDLMTLDDWKSAIDLLASLKFNVFDVGVANNWMIQYEGKRSEFLLLPIRKYPELSTPQSIEYYSAQKGEYVRTEYLARMFEEDFFGDVVAYGASRGVTVYPHFNTPGHNTMIPRKIPEISAKNEHGNPVGYGFCFSNPRTYEVMFDILDEVVDRYLLPNGVKFFHVGMDEVYPILGMDESEPTRVVSPFCKCPECAKHEWYDQFIDYCVALCKHLAEKGIEKIGMWHDSFVRGGRLGEDLAERFRREGILDKIAIHWWRYGSFFDTIHPELGIASWVTPMTGYYYWTPLGDNLNNIYLAARKGAEENAEGAESYCVYYNAYYQNYACLSEYSWNPKGGGSVDDFRGKYNRFLFGDRPEGADAFRHLEFVTGPMRPTSWAIYHYSNAYGLNRRSSFIRENYPQAIVEQIWENPAGVLHNLGLICQHARAAKRIFEQEDLWQKDPAELSKAYSAEMARTAATAHLFLRMANAVRTYRDMRTEGEIDLAALKSAESELASALEEMDSAILACETGLPHYMGPSLIRELTMQRRFAWKLADELRSVIEGVESGRIAALPEIDCMRLHQPRWVGKAHVGDNE